MTSSRKRPGSQSQPPADSAAERMTAVPEPTRGGEDVRRRGWFWHWNALVTQYAPLLGLKGVGLLNSYTVWTDRREESPHRGYAFPSQQSEADFYGEDRAELITINKILVALDLIEIRKEMVLRVDPQGRRWKVPHNFYRVKDHGDDFTLATGDVLRVAELAASDGAVYRYVRRVFSPRFAPIDGDNVWARILPEVRITPVWQALAARATAEEERASRRTRAGHATRKGDTPLDVAADSPTAPAFFVPSAGAGAASDDDDNDSRAVANDRGGHTSVEASNTGSVVDVGGSNSGLPRQRRTSVGPGNTAGATGVEPSNTTYHQYSTTTRDGVDKTERRQGDEAGRREDGKAGKREDDSAGARGPGVRPPGDAPGENAALRAFEGANDRSATPAERKVLRDLAAQYEPLAVAARRERDDVPVSGWGWLEAAVWEAVEAGSAFVAPRRLREILARWERDGFPDRREPGPPFPAPRGGAPRPRSRPTIAAPSPREEPVFIIAEVGLSNRQVWAATLAEMTRRGGISRGDLETWLRPANIVGRDGETLLVGAPNAVARDRIATRLLPALREALTATLGVTVPVVVVVTDENTARGLPPSGEPARGVG